MVFDTPKTIERPRFFSRTVDLIHGSTFHSYSRPFRTGKAGKHRPILVGAKNLQGQGKKRRGYMAHFYPLTSNACCTYAVVQEYMAEFLGVIINTPYVRSKLIFV
jgi:hypothetical protein